MLVAVYCNCLVQLKIVLGPRIPYYNSGCFSTLQFVQPLLKILTEMKTTTFYYSNFPVRAFMQCHLKLILV